MRVLCKGFLIRVFLNAWVWPGRGRRYFYICTLLAGPASLSPMYLLAFWPDPPCASPRPLCTWLLRAGSGDD
ncbi:hypothetical protein T492DRAFT_1067841, partial [Pavlovales sp. CCMP2436]